MIQYKNVQIKYGDFTAIDNINLEINDGEFFTFLGASGCGKTTTLRALVGFIEPSSGEILVSGKVINNVPIEKRNIGIVFQSYALFPSMNVYENLAFGLKVKKVSDSEIKKKVKDIAEKVAISDTQLKRNISELSGGQQQRVALARAMILEPKILCLDEPLSNLDAKLRVDLRLELKRLQKELGITTLYVTHDQEEALTLSDRIAVFNNGKVDQIGTPYDIYSNSKTEYVCTFIGDINKIKSNILSEINKQSNIKFNTEKLAFLRLERISLTPTSNSDISLNGKVVEIEYNGAFTKYIINIASEKLKVISLNSEKTPHKIGDEIKVYIHSSSIMQF